MLHQTLRVRFLVVGASSNMTWAPACLEITFFKPSLAYFEPLNVNLVFWETEPPEKISDPNSRNNISQSSKVFPSRPISTAIKPPVLVPQIKLKHCHSSGVKPSLLRICTCSMSSLRMRISERPRMPPPSIQRMRGPVAKVGPDIRLNFFLRDNLDKCSCYQVTVASWREG